MIGGVTIPVHLAVTQVDDQVYLAGYCITQDVDLSPEAAERITRHLERLFQVEAKRLVSLEEPVVQSDKTGE